MATGSLARARHTISRIHQRTRELEPVTAFGAFAGGATCGTLERNGIMPTSVGGVPLKPLVAAGLLLSAGTRSSKVGAVVRGAGYGVLGAYGYNTGKSGTLIAGEDEIGGDGEDDMLGL